MKILIVDDSDFSADLLIAAIDSSDIEFVKASSGKEALELFAASKPHEYAIIFMDIVMDGIKGNVVADTIRKLEREDAATVRIYAATAYAGFDFDGKTDSFNGIITKPFDRKKLLEIISE